MTSHQESANEIKENLIFAFEKYCDDHAISLGDYYQPDREIPEVWESNDFAHDAYSNIDIMVETMGYDSFSEWFVETYDSEIAPDWVKEWTKELAENYYKIIREL